MQPPQLRQGADGPWNQRRGYYRDKPHRRNRYDHFRQTFRIAGSDIFRPKPVGEFLIRETVRAFHELKMDDVSMVVVSGPKLKAAPAHAGHGMGAIGGRLGGCRDRRGRCATRRGLL